MFLNRLISRSIRLLRTHENAQGLVETSEERLAQEAKWLLATIVETTDDAIVSKSLDGTILSWNAGAERMFGYPPAEILGRHISVLLPPDSVEEEAQIVQRLLRNDRIEHYETVRVAKDGRRLDVSITISPISDPDGRIIGASKIIRDISERKGAEEALKRSRQELETRVEERTRELNMAQEALKASNETLEQRIQERTAELEAANESLHSSRLAALNLMEDAIAARNHAEETNRELASFIYSVSHDLRGPLRSVAGFGAILQEKYAHRLNGQGVDYLTRICNGAEKMSRLIDDLLRLSTISRQAVERKEIDLSTIASGIAAELKEAAPDREVRVDIAKGITVRADPRLMEVMLSNLLRNSWKFTVKTPQAHIALGTAHQDGKCVYFVRDNGAGFDPEYAHKMFLPFHRLHTTDEFEGTGIGLAIVERIIRGHDGKIWAEGKEGQGATVYFTLGPSC